MSGMLTATGPCWGCRRLFVYHPDLVVSIMIDPVTDSPPDLDPETGEKRTGDIAEYVDRSSRQPLCPQCCHQANVAGADPPLDERDSLDRAREMMEP